MISDIESSISRDSAKVSNYNNDSIVGLGFKEFSVYVQSEKKFLLNDVSGFVGKGCITAGKNIKSVR